MKTFQEFLIEKHQLDEASFVSGAPHTGASNGVHYEVTENKEKSLAPHKHFDVHHNGEHVGHVASYSTYEDKKAAGSRVASSRKEVTRWHSTVNAGHHSRSTRSHTDGEYKSKKDALQRLADIHKTKA